MSKLNFLIVPTLIAAFAACAFAQGQTPEKTPEKAPEKSDDVIRVDTNLVTVPVIVSDRDNRYIAGLKQSDFSIFKDAERQSIDYFAAEEAPISVALLLDTSRSTEPVLGKIKKAAQEFVKQMRAGDRTMVVTFDSDVIEVSPLTGDREKLIKAVKGVEVGERFGTVLNDALFETVTKGLAGFRGRKAVIMLTDGKDAGSYRTTRELLYRLQETDVMVYSIFYKTGEIGPFRGGGQRPQGGIFGGGMGGRGGIGGGMGRGGIGGMGRGGNGGGGGGGMGGGGRERPGAERRRDRLERENERALAFLQSLADATAGRLYQKDVGDLKEAFSAIAGELRNQYVIGFYPDNVVEGREYRLRVEVERTNSVVRSKRTFRIGKQ